MNGLRTLLRKWVFHDKLQKDTEPLYRFTLGCATHWASTGCSKDNLNACFVYRVTCGASQWAQISVLSFLDKSGTNSQTLEGWKDRSPWGGNPNQEPCMGYTRQPAPSHTALPLAQGATITTLLFLHTTTKQASGISFFYHATKPASDGVCSLNSVRSNSSTLCVSIALWILEKKACFYLRFMKNWFKERSNLARFETN